MLDKIPSFEEYARETMEDRYSHVVQGRLETWEQIARRVCTHIVGYNRPKAISLSKDIWKEIERVIIERKFIPGGRLLSQTGRQYHQTDNCFTLRAEDTREGWADLAHKCTLMFMSGGGVGVDYSEIRPFGTPLKRSGGIASGPLPLIEMVNSIGAAARQGGERRGAIYASLPWTHQDIGHFMAMKEKPGVLSHTNISVRFDAHWRDRVMQNDAVAYQYFVDVVHRACRYGEPGFQFDDDDLVLRNACTETISKDDCDSCCLGSVNLARIKTLQELNEVTQLGTTFLLAATEYSHAPCPQVRVVKQHNRRIGLGLMGLAEWFLLHGMPYGHMQNTRLDTWLTTWKMASIAAAKAVSSQFNMAMPVGIRAIAPTGTISIAGGLTTPGIEPIFHTAYIRTSNTPVSLDHPTGVRQERLIDPIVVKLLHQGYDVGNIDTAYTLSQTRAGIARRIATQAHIQQYVDQGIASTVNLPQYTPGVEDTVADVLIEYLPQLRGITFYPDGARDGQPIIPIDINDVIEHDDVEMAEVDCKGGSCGL